MRTMRHIFVVFGLLALGTFARSDLVVLQSFPVEPNQYYCLTFELESAPAVGVNVHWVLNTFNSAGDQPFDGTFEGDWQQLVPGQTVYRHAFLSVEDAAEVRFGFRGAGMVLQLKSAILEPVVVPNLVLNGDFALGAGNQSGWSEMNWAAVIGEGSANLLQVNQNGYALTDYFLVEDGGGYNFQSGAKTYPGVTLLAYDQQRRLIGPASNDHKNTPRIRMPEGAAYGRFLFYTWHDHIPTMLTNRVSFAGLVRYGSEPPAARPPVLLPRADEEIVLAPGSDPREVYAARELQHWIAQITGHLPPLLATPSSRENIKIHVGVSLASAFVDDLTWLEGSDGYAVRRQGDAIHIFGAKPRGTIFGVFAFLGRNSGIIWPRPNVEFEAIWTPQAQLTFTESDFRSRPTFALRHISRAAGGYRFQEWMARNGLNTSFALHTGFDYLLWERGSQASYTKSHIGWIGAAADLDNTFYPLVDGQRSISRWRQPCYTHPEAASTIAANIRLALALVPDQPVEHIASIIADNWSVCACERCMQPILLPDGTTLAPTSPYSAQDPLFFSTRNFMMLNAVAEDLAEDFPDLKLVTHAYIFTAEPPLVKLHPMIVPQFAAYPSQNLRFPIRDGRGKVLGSYTADIWQRRFDAWGLWHPQGLGYFGYYYTPGFNALADTAAVDFRDLAEKGGVYAHTEGYPVDGDALSTWDVDGAEKWILAQLMWDPSQDPNVLRETFMSKVYREAAPQMRAFHALISNGWHNAQSDLFLNCHSSVQEAYEGLIEKPGHATQARALLVQGVAAAQHPLAKQLVQRRLDHFDLYREMLGRHDVPLVMESTQEWEDAGSTHWQKALVVKDFKKVDDWRRFGGAPADPQTEVRFMHDGTRLYVRFMAFDAAPGGIVAPPPRTPPWAPNGDRVEVRLLDAQGQNRYLAVGPNSTRYASPVSPLMSWEAQSVVQADGWVALLSLPFDTLGITAQSPALKIRVGRGFRLSGNVRQESTPSGVSLYNLHESFWMGLSMEWKEESP